MLEPRKLLAANMLVNGNFEQGSDFDGIQTNADVVGWKATADDSNQQLLDIVSTSLGNVLEVDGVAGRFDRIFQDVGTVSGQSYLLSFDLFGFGDGTDQSDELRVMWDGNLAGVFRGVEKWQSVAIELTGAIDGTTRLEFRETFSESGGDGRGPQIDNVVLQQVEEVEFGNGGFESTEHDTQNAKTPIWKIPDWFTNGPVEDRIATIREYGEFAPSQNGDLYWSFDSSTRYDRLFHAVETKADKQYVLTYDMRSPLASLDEGNQVRIRWNAKWAATHYASSQWQTFSAVLPESIEGASWLDMREAIAGQDGLGDGQGPWLDNIRIFETDKIPEIVFDLNGTDQGQSNSATFNGETPDVEFVSSSASIDAPTGTELSSVNVRIAKIYDEYDEVLTADTSGTTISSSYDDELGVLVLAGPGSVDEYQKVLRTLRYSNFSLNTTEVQREIEYEAFVPGSPAGIKANANTSIQVAISLDSDDDGITDRAEIDFYGTAPDDFDTDGDLLPDGIEIRTPGLRPLEADDSQADLDGDELVNLDEVIYRTRLHLKDSDRDGTDDGAEVEQGSDPNDRSDSGLAPPEGELVELILSVGDHSGSHSERYNLHVGQIRHQSEEFGVVLARPYKFRKGQSYPIRIFHRDTNLDEPDFDYTANVLSNDGTPIVIEDPLGILGRHDESDPFFAAGKEAILHIPKVSLKEVTFSNVNATVLEDNGGNLYAAPHWNDSSTVVEPVSYTRGDTYEVSAVWEASPPQLFENAKIRATNANGFDIGETIASSSGGELSINGIESERAFPENIGDFNLALQWEIGIGNDEEGVRWFEAGESQNRAFVTLDDPKTPDVFETVLDIGTRNAAGLSDELQIVESIWGEFSDRSVNRVDGTQLTYWAGAATGTCTAVATAGLLAAGDGQCGSWAEFFIDTVAAQGIGGAEKILVKAASPATNFLVKNWQFTTPSQSNSDGFNYVLGQDVVNIDGLPGQGNPNPPPYFYNHFIVRYSGRYYDPSYGGISYSSQNEWENASLDGFFIDSTLFSDRAKPNDPGVPETVFTVV